MNLDQIDKAATEYVGGETDLKLRTDERDAFKAGAVYAAQEEAVGFHEWMWRKMSDSRDETTFRIIPEIGGTYYGSDGIRYTTTYLYAIYLKEKGGEGHE